MDDKELRILLAEKKAREEASKKKYLEDSKQRLLKIITTKMRTIMIGSIDSIEKNLCKPYEDENSDEARMIRDIFLRIRQEILDKGNTQIRNIETEFQQYLIEWLRYRLVLPVKPRQGQGDTDAGK
jgi:hypothetical protein